MNLSQLQVMALHGGFYSMTYNPITRGVPAIARSSAKTGQNQTGYNILKGTPVRATSTGVDLINPSIEAHIDGIAGVVKADIGNGFQGDIVSAGLIENVSVSFDPGSVVYISKTGLLTNIKPTIDDINGFAAGDFVVKVGVIALNTDNNLLKDLLVGMQIMGQL